MRTDLADAVEQVRNHTSGEPSAYLADTTGRDDDSLAAAVCDLEGEVVAVGDHDHPFALQSVSKVFAYVVAVQECGLERVLEHVGVEPSGDSFNEPSMHGDGRPYNPYINAGAIMTHGLLPGGDERAREDLLLDRLSAMAGQQLRVNDEVYEAERPLADRNLAMGHLLAANGMLPDEPHEVVRGYLRQCSIEVTTPLLAVMGATLASGGVNPVTGERVLDTRAVQQAMSVMLTCGMYDSAGEWVVEVGLPAKSGVSGALVAAVPGQMGIATYSPRLDEHGHSVRGQKLIEQLSDDWGLHVLGHVQAPAKIAG